MTSTRPEVSTPSTAPPACPCCHAVLDRLFTRHTRQRPPQPGDLVVCDQCQAPLRFAPAMTLEEVDLSTLSEPLQRDIQAAQDRAKQRNRARGGAEA